MEEPAALGAAPRPRGLGSKSWALSPDSENEDRESSHSAESGGAGDHFVFPAGAVAQIPPADPRRPNSDSIETMISEPLRHRIVTTISEPLPSPKSSPLPLTSPTIAERRQKRLGPAPLPLIHTILQPDSGDEDGQRRVSLRLTSQDPGEAPMTPFSAALAGKKSKGNVDSFFGDEYGGQGEDEKGPLRRASRMLAKKNSVGAGDLPERPDGPLAPRQKHLQSLGISKNLALPPDVGISITEATRTYEMGDGFRSISVVQDDDADSRSSTPRASRITRGGSFDEARARLNSGSASSLTEEMISRAEQMYDARTPAARKTATIRTTRVFLPTSHGKHETGALKFFERMLPKLSEKTLDVIRALHGLEPFLVSDLRRQSDEAFAEIGITNKHDINAIRRPVRTVEVSRVSFLGLKKIDDVEQSFKAEILYECLIKNGQLDDSLMVESKAFCYPYPSAMWIWFAQVDFGNSMGHEIAEQKVFTKKNSDDIHLVMRVVGDFSYQFKLNNFPVDYQDLNVVLEIRCDKKGLTPVRIIVPEDVHTDIDSSHFTLSNVWDLSPKVIVRPAEAGPRLPDGTRQKTYAALHAHARVSRLDDFYRYNLVIPMMIFSGLAVFGTFVINPEEIGDRFEYNVNLMIVAVAYKFATNEMMPKVAYLTLLDSYILSSSLVLVLVVLQNGIAKGTSACSEGCYWPGDFNEQSQYCLLFGWVTLQARFYCVYRKIHQARTAATDPDLVIKSKAVIHAREQLLKFNDIAGSFEMLNLDVPESINHQRELALEELRRTKKETPQVLEQARLSAMESLMYDLRQVNVLVPDSLQQKYNKEKRLRKQAKFIVRKMNRHFAHATGGSGNVREASYGGTLPESSRHASVVGRRVYGIMEKDEGGDSDQPASVHTSLTEDPRPGPGHGRAAGLGVHSASDTSDDVGHLRRVATESADARDVSDRVHQPANSDTSDNSVMFRCPINASDLDEDGQENPHATPLEPPKRFSREMLSNLSSRLRNRRADQNSGSLRIKSEGDILQPLRRASSALTLQPMAGGDGLPQHRTSSDFDAHHRSSERFDSFADGDGKKVGWSPQPWKTPVEQRPLVREGVSSNSRRFRTSDGTFLVAQRNDTTFNGAQVHRYRPSVDFTTMPSDAAFSRGFDGDRTASRTVSSTSSLNGVQIPQDRSAPPLRQRTASLTSDFVTASPNYVRASPIFGNAPTAVGGPEHRADTDVSIVFEQESEL